MPDEVLADSLTYKDLNILIAFKLNSFSNYYKGNQAIEFNLALTSRFVNILGLYRNGMDQKTFGLRYCNDEESKILEENARIISNGV